MSKAALDLTVELVKGQKSKAALDLRPQTLDSYQGVELVKGQMSKAALDLRPQTLDRRWAKDQGQRELVKGEATSDLRPSMGEAHQDYICIVANKNSLDDSSSDLGDVVNPLAKWLLKR